MGDLQIEVKSEERRVKSDDVGQWALAFGGRACLGEGKSGLLSASYGSARGLVPGFSLAGRGFGGMVRGMRGHGGRMAGRGGDVKGWVALRDRFCRACGWWRIAGRRVAIMGAMTDSLRTNLLYFGDNLEWLRDPGRFPDESVDLVYLDPPFNSNRNYNVPIGEDNVWVGKR
jgi:hypothetical protein